MISTSSLSDDELKQLNTLLTSIETSDGLCSITKLHGFLCAVLSGAPQIWETLDDIYLVCRTLQRTKLLKKFQTQTMAPFLVDSEYIEPFLYDSDHKIEYDEASDHLITTWCQAYMKGVSYWPDNEDLEHPLTIIGMLSGHVLIVDDHDVKSTTDGPSKASIIASCQRLLPEYISALYYFWHGEEEIIHRTCAHEKNVWHH